MEKKVIVASGVTNKAKRVTTSATTWGEFKSELGDSVPSGVDAIVKPGNYTLRDDSSVLPEGDFNLYLIPTKNKAGVTEDQAQTIGFKIAAAITKAAQLAGEDRIKELEESLIEEVANFFDVDSDELVEAGTGFSKGTDDAELSKALSELNDL